MGNIGIRMRAVLTRIITIIPCVAIAAAFPSGTTLNMFVNIVNVALSILLPFALFPLAKYNCTPSLMGEEHAIKGWQKWAVYFLVILVYFVNAIIIQVVLQILYAWWLFLNLFSEFKEEDP